MNTAQQLDADVARLAAGQAGRLRIGSFDSACGPIMAQALARFLVRRREVEISLDQTSDPADGRIERDAAANRQAQ